MASLIDRLRRRKVAATPAALAAVALREAAEPIDPDDDVYRTVNAALRDLYGNALRRAQELSVQMFRANPLANRVIKIQRSYMAGSGFGISCDNPDVQAVCEEFWTAERNRLDRNHRGLAAAHLIFGESFFPVGVDDGGATTLGVIDPGRVTGILLNPNNNLLLDTVVIGTVSGPEELTVVRTQDDPDEAGAGLMTGDTFAFLHDRIGTASRGTPYLLPVLDWLDAYDQTMWELLERLKVLRAHFWDVTVEGGATEVAEAQTQFGTDPPRTGTVRFHTSATKVEALAPDLNATDDVQAARHILRLIATGVGLAPHWLGDPEDANRSTAESMDAPVVRGLEEVQAEWKLNLEDVLRFAVDQKVAKGLLPREVPVYDEQGRPTDEMARARDTVEIQVPDLTSDDLTAAAGSLAAMGQAFISLQTVGAVTPEIMRRLVRQVLPAFGIPVDELPDPDADDTSVEQLASALESLEREGRRTRAWDKLLEELAA